MGNAGRKSCVLISFALLLGSLRGGYRAENRVTWIILALMWGQSEVSEFGNYTVG